MNILISICTDFQWEKYGNSMTCTQIVPLFGDKRLCRSFSGVWSGRVCVQLLIEGGSNIYTPGNSLKILKYPFIIKSMGNCYWYGTGAPVWGTTMLSLSMSTLFKSLFNMCAKLDVAVWEVPQGRVWLNISPIDHMWQSNSYERVRCQSHTQ